MERPTLVPTATVHLPTVDGYAGPARCFAVDPPYLGHSYVTVWAQPSFGPSVGPEACLIPAGETGAAATLPDGSRSLKRHPGSYVLHDEPDTPQRLDGAYAFALLMLGGYTVVPPAAT